MGNLHSVKKALELFGAKTLIARRPLDIEKCAKVVLPGVGAFDDAMLELKRRGLILAIKEHIRKGKPFLGICLGMQLLFESSQEAKTQKGLGVLKGAVKKFKKRPKLKIPHMGWNQLKLRNKDCPLLKGIPEKSFVYFCHSYYPDPLHKGLIAAGTSYGVDFASVIWQGNIYGAQFHPEKSQETGLKMLRNFVAMRQN